MPFIDHTVLKGVKRQSSSLLKEAFVDIAQQKHLDTFQAKSIKVYTEPGF